MTLPLSSPCGGAGVDGVCEWWIDLRVLVLTFRVQQSRELGIEKGGGNAMCSSGESNWDTSTRQSIALFSATIESNDGREHREGCCRTPSSK